MENTTAPSSTRFSALAGVAGQRKQQPHAVVQIAKQILAPLASLRLTVALFSLSILLVFFGTLGLVDEGLWTVLRKVFRAQIAWIPFQALVHFGQIFFGLSKTLQISGSFPFPGGWLLGEALMINLLAAHAVRFRISWKRSGILLLHSGLLIMMLGEWVTGVFAIESRMTIAVGESVNFTDDGLGKVELALIDSSNPKVDDVVVIPESFLRQRDIIHNDLLPCDIEILEYMKNSELVRVTGEAAGRTDTVLRSDGERCTVIPEPEGSGAAANQREDAPAVRAAFYAKGTKKDLGTYLFSLWYYPNFTKRIYQFAPQKVTVGEKTYTVELRYKRVYKPFNIELKEFRHDVYVGTDKPKNFSSRVQLVNSARAEDREVVISMNDPLRYQGETLYQSGYFPDDQGTILQVVRNPGWLMPYVSCALVALGMIIHFGLSLTSFLRRRIAA